MGWGALLPNRELIQGKDGAHDEADANPDNCRTRDRHAPIVHLVSRCASCRPGRNALRRRTFHSLLADKEALTAVLLRHVVPGAALASCNVPRGITSLDTAGGESIEVTRDRYIKIKSSAGEAGVVAFDIMATNGVVHIVNSVF